MGAVFEAGLVGFDDFAAFCTTVFGRDAGAVLFFGFGITLLQSTYDMRGTFRVR